MKTINLDKWIGENKEIFPTTIEVENYAIVGRENRRPRYGYLFFNSICTCMHASLNLHISYYPYSSQWITSKPYDNL